RRDMKGPALDILPAGQLGAWQRKAGERDSARVNQHLVGARHWPLKSENPKWIAADQRHRPKPKLAAHGAKRPHRPPPPLARRQVGDKARYVAGHIGVIEQLDP